MSSPLTGTAGSVQGPTTYAPPSALRITTLEDVASVLGRIFGALRDIARRVNAIEWTDARSGPQHGSKAGDHEARWLYVLAPSVPDETFEVAHFLGRTPVGFFAMPIGRPAVFYAPGTLGAHGWGPTTIKLRCNTKDAAALIFVF